MKLNLDTSLLFQKVAMIPHNAPDEVTLHHTNVTFSLYLSPQRSSPPLKSTAPCLLKCCFSLCWCIYSLMLPLWPESFPFFFFSLPEVLLHLKSHFPVPPQWWNLSLCPLGQSFPPLNFQSILFLIISWYLFYSIISYCFVNFFSSNFLIHSPPPKKLQAPWYRKIILIICVSD